jgi:hypothetical protein
MAIDGRTQSLRSVVDDMNVSRMSEIDDRSDFGGIAEQMGDDNSLGLAAENRFHGFRSYVEFLSHVGKHRYGTDGEYWRNYGRATKSGDDNFVAWAHAQSAQSDFETETPRAARNHGGNAKDSD